MKIAWLTQYDIYKLLPEIVINRKTTLHSSSWIHSLSENLSTNKEVELHIITHTQLVDKTQHFKKNGIFFHIIKYSSPFTKRGFPWYFPFDKMTGYYSFARNARKVIEQINPDVLHVHGTEGGYFRPASKSKIPCIISIQGIISEYIKIEPSIGNYLQLPYEQSAVRSARYFGCRTNFDYDFVKKFNKDAVIYDLPEAMNKVFFEQEWKPSDELSILFVGSVNKRKGIVDLIYAMIELKKKFPSILLKVIGSGQADYKEFLQKIIDEHDLSSNIRWLGNKAPAEVALELSRSSFFVLPTLMDNSPNCLAEAMAVGVPSIATRVGGIPSMIEDKVDGLLYEKHDVKELVKLIEQLANDREFQLKLSTNAREKAFNRNHPSNVTKKYVEVYKSLIK
jgi:glycosyltransferase involved in cell wall biosynthesis